MTGRDNFDRIMRQRSQGQPKKNPRFSGYLGITTGGESVIDIPNRAGFVWVRLRNAANEVIQAFNDSVSPLYNLPVLVERDLSSPIRYKIIGVDRDIYGGNWGTASSYIPNHGAQHSFNRDDSSTAGDITWIYTDQFLPLLVAPSGSSGAANVIVYPYLYHDNGGNYFCAGNTGTATLLGNLPTGSSNARMSLVYLDVSTGNPMILAGTDEFANTITGTCGVLQYIPGVPDNDDIALAGVRLITGTSTIRWENLYDIREFIHKHPSSGTSGGGGSGDNTLLIYDDSVFKVTGTAISFDDNLEVAVTGSIAYVDCGPEVLFSLVEIGTVASPHISLDVLKGHTAIRARNELRFYTSGSYVGFETPLLPTGTSQIWVLPDADGDANEVLTTDGGGNLSWSAGGEGATGSVGPSGDNTLLIYDDSVFKVTGTAISFDDNLLVHVTGSYAYVDWTGSGGGGGYTEGARVYNSADISIPNNTITTLTFDSESYDTDTIHSTVANTDRLTCVTAGKYIIGGNAWFYYSTGTRKLSQILLNATTIIAFDEKIGVYSGMNPVGIYDLDVDDYLQFQLYQNSGGAVNVTKYANNPSPSFWMQRIG